MDDFARSIFDKAVVREQLSRKLYLDLAQKSNLDSLRNLFEKLAAEEELHERLFKKMDVSTVKTVNSENLGNLNLLDNIESPSLDDIEEINKALDFAISEEDGAFKDYNRILIHLDFGEARSTLNEIAHQELNHKRLLQKVKLEFNRKDWKVK